MTLAIGRWPNNGYQIIFTMNGPCFIARFRGLRRKAFTLVEIVVSLTILGIIAAVAIPTMKGLNNDEKVREPVARLAALVQEARHRATTEHRAYQILFEPGGIHASPEMYPHDNVDDYLRELEEMRRPPPDDAIERTVVERQEITGGVLPGPFDRKDPTPHFEMPWTVSIAMEKDMSCAVLMWGDGEWDVLEGDKMRRWIFQPSGMANPARVRLSIGHLQFEAGFDALTGALNSERIRPISTKP